MLKKSFKSKIILPVIAILFMSFLVLIIVVSVQFSNFNDGVVSDKTLVTTEGVKREIDQESKRTYIAAVNTAKDRDVIDALISKDKDKLLDTLTPLIDLYEIAYFTISDENGDVLLRTYDPEKFGDSVVGQANIRNALAGETSTFFEQGSEIKVAIRTGAPIYDENDNLIGAVSAGFRLDTELFVDRIKQKFAAESTVFLGDTRIMTTLMDEGKRAIGTKMSDSVQQIVIKGQKEHLAHMEIFGTPYDAYYMPLFNSNNEVFAVVFTGVSTEYAEAESNAFTLNIVVIGIIVLGISVLVLILITNAIGRPITMITNELTNLADGKLSDNLNVKNKDEIGSLAASVIKVSGSIKLLADEINIKIDKYNNGFIKHNIPTENFNGCYKLIAEDINIMSNAMNKDLTDILGCLAEFSRGNFQVVFKELPNEKAIANQYIEVMRQNLINVKNEILVLVNAAINGELSTRADVEKYSGNWKELIEGLNTLLEEVSIPFDKISGALIEMSKGNMQIQISGQHKGDYAVITNAFNETVKTLSSYISEINSVLHDMANDNFRVSIAREYIGDFNQIKTSLNLVIDTFNNVLSEIAISTDQISSGSSQISASSQTLASGAAEQTLGVNNLERSMNEISELIHNTAANSNKAEELTAVTSQSALIGKERMINMVDAMNKIADASISIANIMKVIDDIAFQTNLLALNAAVEAARAGEHGNGFAVVAEEVRHLALRSQTSATEIDELIQSTIAKISDGVKIASSTSADLDKISSEIAMVSDIVKEIAKDASYQAKSISDNNDNIAMISKVTLSNSATSEETASASQELASQSEQFRNTVQRFKLRPNKLDRLL